jgi:hypothetical protein
LIYVSQRKLTQFQEERPRGGLMRHLRSMAAKAPMSLGEISVGLAEPEKSSASSLERVVSAIQESAAWYGEVARAVPGTWVQFEAKLNYATTSLQDGRLVPGDDGPLFFWEPHTDPVEGPDTTLANQTDSPRRVRLVLHATSDGLLGSHADAFVEHEPCLRTGTFPRIRSGVSVVASLKSKHSFSSSNTYRSPPTQTPRLGTSLRTARSGRRFIRSITTFHPMLRRGWLGWLALQA